MYIRRKLPSNFTLQTLENSSFCSGGQGAQVILKKTWMGAKQKSSCHKQHHLLFDTTWTLWGHRSHSHILWGTNMAFYWAERANHHDHYEMLNYIDHYWTVILCWASHVFISEGYTWWMIISLTITSFILSTISFLGK